MKLAGALFDFDGTLISNGHYHIEAVRSVLERHLGASVDSESVRQLTGLKYYDKLVHLLAERGIDDDELAAELEQQASEHYHTNHSIDSAIIPGLPLFLQRLSDAGVTMAVVTSASNSYAVDHLMRADLSHFFASVTGGDDVKNRKPDPEPYLKNLGMHGLASSNTVVFEDSPPGLAAGMAAGLPVIALLTNFSREELPGAALYISDYSELTLEMLEEIL
ncbi:MAG: hypothetical protein COW24_04735 [Candidatus Kerfeldbacteria bacterium CG15_BIG_FIL_POST_REV_8_21_14_020_45_12]|uniref:HAD family phosphatase n=1 Tax=Candidatus Kerfeldbacteria bacterium CG15_BIG_FIL_POST_REV_8_21_14_020_45_12 TaxID=2014247 RepID=A0A2M7H2N5_9BACT|nr:MAG: hypothetical protein COW24_04735 [Candidatus Kerfeldbacteria bacterium CG15_BIG_FIL_POST_REV_8_21_14_020_45_12]PJA93275.1 MAG: hypothetical protein CO132_04185 [Candidatus Kerfeldbacteria bacterium CG_4_9_14_3_um_filter_45_8]